ncbi:hypothetical protein HCQ94_01245 [Actinomyces sp. zg-332]|uniref:hypothetical protein n=1 Tax=Actinomyces sp. zg-332 TaxID=2708340 RepID=UPI001420124B|nr:hypothetical protein [Actinomyces sp. zg-332]QPK94364.1 hypothetical protein HCQ94_01245 [Actinomyces sp. zg-332]
MKYKLYLNARFQPYIRYEFEDILENFLTNRNLGSLIGGKTTFEKTGEIKSCNIDFVTFSTTELSDYEIQIFQELFENTPIPKGSELKSFPSNTITPLGTLEGLGLYLNGKDLPDEVYANNDVNDLNDLILERLENEAEIMSYSEYETFTALYYYGLSYSQMLEKIKDVVSSNPLCKKSKIIQIA